MNIIEAQGNKLADIKNMVSQINASNTQCRVGIIHSCADHYAHYASDNKSNELKKVDQTNYVEAGFTLILTLDTKMVEFAMGARMAVDRGFIDAKDLFSNDRSMIDFYFGSYAMNAYYEQNGVGVIKEEVIADLISLGLSAEARELLSSEIYKQAKAILEHDSPSSTEPARGTIIEDHWPNAGDMILCYEDAIAANKLAITPLAEWVLDEIYNYFEDTGNYDEYFGDTTGFLKQFSIEPNDCKDNQWGAGKIIAVNHKTEEKVIYRPS